VALTASAEAFRDGSKPDGGSVHTPDHLDRNGNIYFIMFGNTFSNRGFVYRNGDAGLLEDGVEPDIIEARHLFDNWWFYIGS